MKGTPIYPVQYDQKIKMIENIKPLDEGEEEFVSIDEAIEQVDKYQPTPKKIEDEKPDKEPENEPEEELTSKISTYDFLIGEFPAADGDFKTQDEWIKFYRDDTGTAIFASMPDLYVAFKELKEVYESGAPEDKAKAEGIIDSLRHDFKTHAKGHENRYLVSSTRMIYKPRKWLLLKKSFDAQIIHRYGSGEEIKISNIEVPVYPKLVNDSPFLQALFQTQDDIETIVETLEFITGGRYLSVRTPHNDSRHNFVRSEFPHRPVGLGRSGENLVVKCDLLTETSCESRGIRPYKND